MIKEQYQKEISQIHAPKQLLEKTKEAMKEEEKRLLQQRKVKASFPFGKVLPAVAAAAVLLLSFSVAVIYFKDDQASLEQEIPLQLGGKQEPEIGKIENGNNAGLTIREVSKMPEEFLGISGTLVGEDTVLIVKDGETGAFKAYYENEQIRCEIFSEITDEKEFMEALERKMKELHEG